MRGVKIVSRTETTKIIVDDEARPIPIILFVFFTIIATAVSILGIIKANSPDPADKRFEMFAFIFAVTFFFISAVIFTGFAPSVTKESTYKYKVIVAEGTDMDEFNEKYEVLTQKGRVYEVIERDPS